MTNSHETFGQNMKHQATEKLNGRQVCLALMTRAKSHGSRVNVKQAGIADPNTVSVATEIAEYGLGATKGRFAVDQPTLAMQLVQQAVEAERVLSHAEPVSFENACSQQASQTVEKLAAKKCTQHSDREQIAWACLQPAVAIGAESTTRYDTVQMWMKTQIASPSVENGCDPQQPSQAFGICAQLKQCL